MNSGQKNFEIRLADLEVMEGDVVLLQEWDPKTKKYTNRKIKRKINYILKTKDLPFWTKEEVDKHGFQVWALEEKC